MKKIMTIFGTRPEAIKMAPLVLALKNEPELEPIVVVTAQHREMLDSVLETFNITPDFDLNIMKQGQTLSEVTSRVLGGLESVIQEAKPDMILVHGDTTTTFAGSLAAFYNEVAIGHVEAGLRTWNKYSPFPEEMNRQMTGVLADLHFSPTEQSKNNLLHENKKSSSIVVTGNTAIDALSTTVNENYKSKIIARHEGKRIVLLTAHRRENIGKPMENIFKAVRRIVEEEEDVVVVYPMHKNPKVRSIANEVLSDHKRIELIEPLEVIDFHNFAANAHLILTDSGGVQEEAPSLGKPVLVLRDTTERPEGVEAGTLKLVGVEEEDVYNETKLLLNDQALYDKMSIAQNPYGDGLASKRICENIKYYFGIIENSPEPFKKQ
ncbi:non-hydrolyzing UDP-N-acetylglucosamine 2-epimerase [Mammaliicoccus stepanovicii]|uniref:UDP-N-acetylglucosamine 2-epimerase (non-hydrolyzing) n=1 Tax=Mammaliicoccus stepanovicii TaxID=643214 RepID=A0A239YNL5_9STAP|nr:UDP-N-acetylglucosamine 2-epimerase (non-hydrolyzing) [Mammaliicoccus stepanovicii]PNZ78921.1 UDP-N-acetylglucosamine 2-epimerase (non-hydrolyzing) [Mammaliicoccus stepanovicii]GGI41239.1 UDP-N-acetyl glucosamine 2-epimerase [Mammaliicoccus stepanovicii]SNV60352.1 UDP-N-acetylglucosamine 2-epimerase [Mammaliicoccus stepanovicii]